MRSRWEDTADETLDEPVTITERQLRALKRSAKLGMFAMPLAIIALGLGVWSLLGGSLPGTKADVQQAAAQPAPSAAPAPQAAPSDSGPMPVGGGSTSATPAGTAPAGTTPVGSLAKGGPTPATPTPTPAPKPAPKARHSGRVAMRPSHSHEAVGGEGAPVTEPAVAPAATPTSSTPAPAPSLLPPPPTPAPSSPAPAKPTTPPKSATAPKAPADSGGTGSR